VGLTNLYRIVLIGGYLKDMPGEINFLNTVVVPVLFSIGVLFAGYFIFKKCENRFSDYLNV
jgi:ABC-type polysaccharide/polyol phosphate export permease